MLSDIDQVQTKNQTSILQDYVPGRAVRSVSRNLICERRTKTATGAKAFGLVAPKVWQATPLHHSDTL